MLQFKEMHLTKKENMTYIHTYSRYCNVVKGHYMYIPAGDQHDKGELAIKCRHVNLETLVCDPRTTDSYIQCCEAIENAVLNGIKDGDRQRRKASKGGNTKGDMGDSYHKLYRIYDDKEYDQSYNTETDTVLNEGWYRRSYTIRNKRNLPDDIGNRLPAIVQSTQLPDDFGNQKRYWAQKEYEEREREKRRRQHRRYKLEPKGFLTWPMRWG